MLLFQRKKKKEDKENQTKIIEHFCVERKYTQTTKEICRFSLESTLNKGK